MSPEPAAARPTESEWRIVPGLRVGPITGDVEKSDLARLFPGANVTHEPCTVAEGDEMPCSQISLEGEVALRVYWNEEDGRAAQVDVSSPRFSTEQGIAIGMSLQKLVEANEGRPLTFYGFDWDMSGLVLSKSGGPVDKLQLEIALGYPEGTPHERIAPLMGEQELRSDDPRVASLGIRIESLSAFLASSDARPATATKLPSPAPIEHGKTYWAVYFASAPMDSEVFRAAKARTEAMGMTLFHKDAGCDEPLGPAPKAVQPESYLLSEYYASEADARAVAEAFGDPTPWVGQVRTLCLD